MNYIISLALFTIKWELIERIVLSREALIFFLIIAILWLVKIWRESEKEKKELYRKLEQLLTGALISEKLKNHLAKNRRQAKNGKSPENNID